MGRRKALPPDFDGNYTLEMLSERQRDILAFVAKYIKENHYPPSVREIGEAVGLSSSASVHNHLRFLQEKGFISKAEPANEDNAKPKAKSRSIVLNNDNESWRNKEVVPVPLVGKVTAGMPILAVENIEETYPIPRDLIGCTEDVFMLEVSGDSMIKAGILDHDYLVVRKQEFANNGDIVVALIDNETTTVKRYFKDLRSIRLQPENDKYKPIIGGDNIQVLGKVISVFRML